MVYQISAGSLIEPQHIQGNYLSLLERYPLGLLAGPYGLPRIPSSDLSARRGSLVPLCFQWSQKRVQPIRPLLAPVVDWGGVLNRLTS
jgi:hypothetical protein